MPDDLLGTHYSDSLKPLRKGDLVLVDDREGRVEELCLPQSQVARDYSCEDTGGVLIQFDDGILALLRFGTYHRIVQATGHNDSST